MITPSWQGGRIGAMCWAVLVALSTRTVPPGVRKILLLDYEASVCYALDDAGPLPGWQMVQSDSSQSCSPGKPITFLDTPISGGSSASSHRGRGRGR